MRQANQQHGDQPDPSLRVDEQGWQVADANGLFRAEPRQQEDLRQQHGYPHQCGDQEGHAPPHQAAQPGAHRHAHYGSQRYASHDDGVGLGHAHTIRRQAAAEGDGGCPETADTDTQQHAADQQQIEVASIGHDRVGDNHDQRQADQQVAPVQRTYTHGNYRGGQRGHDAGQGHHQAGKACTDAKVAGDIVEHAHRQEFTGHQGEGTHSYRENRQPLLFDALLIMFGTALRGQAGTWHGVGFQGGEVA
ncbi:hypothetical protein D3C79_731000 [compost metagenome]